MPRLTRSSTATVHFTFEGQKIEAQAGDTIAAALLSAGILDLRTTPVSGAPRGPLCMMGVCFDCLVLIDSAGNQQACMREVREGMCVTRQIGAFDAAAGLTTGSDDEGAAS